MAVNRRWSHRGWLVTPALVTALAMVFGAGVAQANHDLYRRISAGEINGNGAYFATFQGSSSDGSRAWFTTDEQLVAADTDSDVDVYQRMNGRTTLISQGQINGNGAFGAFFVGATPDGTRVFFVTSEQLVGADTDNQQDIYQRFNGVTTRISAGQINGNSFGSADFKAVSKNGKRVIFETTERLVAGDADDATDVYVRVKNKTKRISRSAVAGSDEGGANFLGASNNGKRVFFRTYERLVANDTDENEDIYERRGRATRRVSIGTINGNSSDTSTNWLGSSANGKRVFFASNERLLPNDTDNEMDIYQRFKGVTTRLTTGPTGGNGNFFTSFHGASQDGTKVVFSTAEQLVASDTDGDTDLYMRNGSTTTLLTPGTTSGFPFFVGMSADGSRIFFQTDEQLSPADTDAEQDIYQRAGGVTTLISAGAINGNGAFDVAFRHVSTDGSRVVFTTSEALVADDGDSVMDVYERVAGETHLLSMGDDSTNANYEGATPDGRAVYMGTFEKWLANDKDTQYDIYAAYTSP